MTDKGPVFPYLIFCTFSSPHFLSRPTRSEIGPSLGQLGKSVRLYPHPQPLGFVSTNHKPALVSDGLTSAPDVSRAPSDCVNLLGTSSPLSFFSLRHSP